MRSSTCEPTPAILPVCPCQGFFLDTQRPVMPTGDSTGVQSPSLTYTLSSGTARDGSTTEMMACSFRKERQKRRVARYELPPMASLLLGDFWNEEN